MYILYNASNGTGAHMLTVLVQNLRSQSQSDDGVNLNGRISYAKGEGRVWVDFGRSIWRDRLYTVSTRAMITMRV